VRVSRWDAKSFDFHTSDYPAALTAIEKGLNRFRIDNEYIDQRIAGYRIKVTRTSPSSSFFAQLWYIYKEKY
jgi:hypothetical protein